MIRRTLKPQLRNRLGRAEDEVERLLRDRPPAHQRILTLLREGMSYRKIAEHLNTTEKTIWRLIRRLDPEAQRPCPPS